MSLTYRAIEGILWLVQLVPLVVFSAGSLRVRPWLLAEPRQVTHPCAGDSN